MAARKSLAYFIGHLQRSLARSYQIMKKPLQIPTQISTFRHFSKTPKTVEELLDEKDYINEISTRYTKLFKNIPIKITRDISFLDPSSYQSYIAAFFEKYLKSDGLTSDPNRTRIELQILKVKQPHFLKIYKQFLENDGRKLSGLFLANFMLEYSTTEALDRKEVIEKTYQEIEIDTMVPLNYRFIAEAFAWVNDWTKCEEVFNKMDEMDLDDYFKVRITAGQNLMMAALYQNKPDKFFSFLKKMKSISDKYLPSSKLVETYFKQCEEEGSLFRAIDLVEHLERLKWIASTRAAKTIYQHFSQYEKENWKCFIGQAYLLHCSACSTQLKRNELTEKELADLMGIYHDKKSPFKREGSTVDYFKNFFRHNGTFDVFVDGRTIDVMLRRQENEELEKVIKFFPDKDILILTHSGHVLMAYKNGTKETTFLAKWNNLGLSHVMMYAAFVTGKDALVLSNVNFSIKIHKSMPELLPLYNKWRNLSQLTFNKTTKEIKPPIIHEPYISKDANGWHIPFQNGQKSKEASHEYPRMHICLRNTKEDMEYIHY